MEVKSTLKVVNIRDIKGAEGVIPEQSMRRLIGCPEIPTDRSRVGHATYTPGSIEALHWHPLPTTKPANIDDNRALAGHETFTCRNRDPASGRIRNTAHAT